VVSVNKERILRWVEELSKEQEKTAREEARKEEILQMLGELAKLAEHQRYPSVHPLRAYTRLSVSRLRTDLTAESRG
jgi:hypothetical protein